VNVIFLFNYLGKYGGGENFLIDLLDNFSCKVTVVADRFDESIREKINCIHINEVSKELIDESDLLVCHTGDVERHLHVFKGLKTVVMAHSDSVDWFLENEKYADYFLAVSERVKNKIKEKTDVPCYVCHPGINKKKYKTKKIVSRNSLGFEDSDFIVGQFCRLKKIKNIDLTIEAIKKTKAKLLLIGSDDSETNSEETRILEKCKKEIPNQFKHIRYIPVEDIGSYYNVVDVSCLSSAGEGCSLNIWESFLFGKPFISTPVGSAKEFIQNGVNGYLVQDAKDMSDKFKKLSKDKNLLREMSENAFNSNVIDISTTANLLDQYFNTFAGFPDLKIDKKINFFPSNMETFGHQEGWVLPSLAINNSFNNYGVSFFSWLDRELFLRPIDELWTGILHNVVGSFSEVDKDHILPVCDLVKSNNLQKSLSNCMGIFALSDHVAKYLESNLDIPVETLYHPIPNMPVSFNIDEYLKGYSVIHIGQWMRKYQSFLDLKLPKHSKKIASCESWHFEQINKMNCQVIPRMDKIEYNCLFKNHVVFLDFYDVSACNVVMECIAANTPIVIRNHPANVEYLGKDYPLYFDTIEEAEFKLNCDDLIYQGHKYLLEMDKEKFNIRNFIKSLKNSKIFRNLPNISPKPLFRWTLGKTSKKGYEVFKESITSTIKHVGKEKFDWVICHNGVPYKDLYRINDLIEKQEVPIKLVRQKSSDLPLPHNFNPRHDATTGHGVSGGSWWKVCPARLRMDSHEIIMDNDIVLFKKIPEFEEFLNSNNKTLIMEDSTVHLGRYDFLFNLYKEPALNSGVLGMPPGFDYEKKIYDTWNESGQFENLVGGDEQGLLTAVLKLEENILIPRNRIMGLHAKALSTSAFNSGLPYYSVLKELKRDNQSYRTWIRYSDVDIIKLSKSEGCCGFHFFQINRDGIHEGYKYWIKDSCRYKKIY
jgi:hypothetical protein